MYKLTFTLKQHTPIIHFQHDQEGATLRASEVKPKLDRYLDCFLFAFDFEKIKKYLTGYTNNKDHQYKVKYENGYNAIDYQISIKPLGNIIITMIPDRFPCYFGNMGDDNQQNPKKFSFTNEPISITIATNHVYLYEELKNEVSSFFARNNFGTRQSKGFGSFYITQEDPFYFEPNLLSFYTLANNVNSKAIFESIQMVHKALRSGINAYGAGAAHTFYMKPLIWQYFKNSGITWDKKATKQNFRFADAKKDVYANQISAIEQDDWPVFYISEKQKLVKDLLGLSSVENWMSYHAIIKKHSTSISRMKSPILYKPVRVGDEMRIYIDCDRIPDEFYDQSFTISNGTRSFNILTPVLEEFNIEDFLIWSFKYKQINELIGDDYLGTDKATEIIIIFTELNDNL